MRSDGDCLPRCAVRRGIEDVDNQKLIDQAYSQVTPRRDLNLVDLSTTALRKLGVQRNELIDTIPRRTNTPTHGNGPKPSTPRVPMPRGFPGCRGRTTAP